MGHCVYIIYIIYINTDVFQGSLGESLKEVRPTIFLGVPRVWEKMQEKMMAVAKNQWRIQTIIARWAKSIGLAGNMSLMNGYVNSKGRRNISTRKNM